MHNEIETASPEERRNVQNDRLQEVVERLYENVDHYRDQFDEAGISPSDVETVDDLDRLPFTTKGDLLDNYPDGMFAVDDEEQVRVHASSGTGGKSKIVAYTDHDMAVWNEVVARLYASGGMTAGDTYQVSLGYGLFTGGFGFHQGAEEIGARIIPMSGGNTKRQIQMMRDLDSDAIGCITSYALYIAETAESMGLDPRNLPVSTVYVGGEQTTEAMMERIGEALDAEVYSNYGFSEAIGPGVAAQCGARSDSMHVQSDHFYPEIVDPDTGERVEEGEEGELVFTTLTKEALPLLRYRTGDIASLHRGECECGRTTVRMSHVTGRTDDMLVVRGTNVFPSQIEEVIYDFPELTSAYRIDVRRDGTLDTLELTVEQADEVDGDAAEIVAQLEGRLSEALQLTPDEVDVVPSQTLERTEVGKVERVFDHRE